MSEVPRSVNLDELQRPYDEVGERDGWDFSAVAIESEPELWDYGELVRRYPSDRPCAGHRHRRRRAVPAAGRCVRAGHRDRPQPGHDSYGRTKPAGIAARADRLPGDGRACDDFGGEEFDVVLDCHAWVEPEQIVRVLRPGGYAIAKSWAGTGIS